MRVTNEFVFFFTAKDFLSQWYDAGFKYRDLYFKTSEHFMMFSKACLFEYNHLTTMEIISLVQSEMMPTADKNKPKSILTQIIKAQTPREAKALGKQVKGFVKKQWEDLVVKILYTASDCKFSQNPELKKQFLSLGKKTFVEASKFDCIYGIGMSEDDPDATNPEKWKGQNLLGIALTKLSVSMHNSADPNYSPFPLPH